MKKPVSLSEFAAKRLLRKIAHFRFGAICASACSPPRSTVFPDEAGLLGAVHLAPAWM
jgi:hypothetical protein